MDITSISNNILGEASQAMDSGVYLVQCVRCPTVPNSMVLIRQNISSWIFTNRL